MINTTVGFELMLMEGSASIAPTCILSEPSG